MDLKDVKFVTVKYYNSPNKVTLDNGLTVTRAEKIDGVICAPYDNHFIYEVPKRFKRSWFAMCTCGSPAVIVGSDVYKEDASPTKSGQMIVCLSHANTGKHATGDN